MIEKTIELAEQFEEENWGWKVGIRFEDKERALDEVIEELSRHNQDREDEREFPEYGTDEYEDLTELDGVCAYDIQEGQSSWQPNNAEREARNQFLTNHCYLIASRDIGRFDDYDPDHGEILLQNPKVIAKLF